MKTVNELTIVMNNLERIIQHFNRKYNFQIDKAPEIEQQAFNNLLARWDNLKAKRDRAKSKSFNHKTC